MLSTRRPGRTLSDAAEDLGAMQRTDPVGTLSPELALVDEQLHPARHTLHETPTPPTQPRLETGPSGPSKPVRSAPFRSGLLVVAAAVVLSLLVAGKDNEAGPVTKVTSPRAPAATVVGQDVVLRWKPTQRARLYNVILWRSGVRVLDLWPTRPTARVPVGRLEAGEYQWFVYPMLGSAADGRYGRVIARGTVKV